MRGALLVTCCWPGLSRVWLRGEPGGLLPAVAFAAAVNGAMWLSFGSSVRLATTWQAAIWLALLAVWIVCSWRSYQALPGLAANNPGPEAEDLFRRAQTEYLKGHWFEAEGLASQIIRRFPRDLEARLLLVSVYRRMRRLDEARGELRTLSRFERAGQWDHEIEEEIRRLAEVSEEKQIDDEKPVTERNSLDSAAKAA